MFVACKQLTQETEHVAFIFVNEIILKVYFWVKKTDVLVKNLCFSIFLIILFTLNFKVKMAIFQPLFQF